MVLYCKNKAIYDIDKEKVINKDLLPGLMRKILVVIPLNIG